MSYSLTTDLAIALAAQQTSRSFEDSEEVIVQFDSTVLRKCKLSTGKAHITRNASLLSH